MPFGRYPGRVRDFKKWSATQIDNSELSNSATPKARASKAPRKRRSRRWRRKRRTKKEE